MDFLLKLAVLVILVIVIMYLLHTTGLIEELPTAISQ